VALIEISEPGVNCPADGVGDGGGLVDGLVAIALAVPFGEADADAEVVIDALGCAVADRFAEALAEA